MPTTKSAVPAGARVEVSIRFANGGRLDPEDIFLLDTIRTTRSIMGASRMSGISYRKCWLMVDALNRTFTHPLVATFPGRRDGGAEITPFGERLIAIFHSVGRHGNRAAARTLDEFVAVLNPDFAAAATVSDPATPVAPEPRSA
ncbi:MAG: LysR family transcriptional regulator [Hyphomicrobiaceae bacterium]|nr:LysR family transcriptional regulator [Hyphomicrobiaceae bacterium]